MIDREPESEGETETELTLDQILGAGLEEAHDAFTEAEAGAEGEATPAAATGDRDEQGRFKARGDAPGDGTAKAGETGDKITDQGTKTGDGAAAQPPSDAPASWSAAAKAHWKTLPPDVQVDAHRLAADFAKGIEQKSQGYKQLETVIEPRRQMLAATYGSVENGISELLNLSDFAVTKPQDFVKWFVHQHRLDPQQIFADAATGAQPGNGQQPGEVAQAALPPDVAAAIDRVERSQEQFIEQYVNRPIKARVQSELTKFEADATTKYPHWSNPKVKQSVAALLERTNEDLSYEDAYDRVVWAMPEIRQQLLDAERQTAIAKKTEEAAKVAATAKKATGARFSPATPSRVKLASGGIDQTMNEVYDRMNGA